MSPLLAAHLSHRFPANSLPMLQNRSARLLRVGRPQYPPDFPHLSRPRQNRQPAHSHRLRRRRWRPQTEPVGIRPPQIAKVGRARACRDAILHNGLISHNSNDIHTVIHQTGPRVVSCPHKLQRQAGERATRVAGPAAAER